MHVVFIKSYYDLYVFCDRYITNKVLTLNNILFWLYLSKYFDFCVKIRLVKITKFFI